MIHIFHRDFRIEDNHSVSLLKEDDYYAFIFDKRQLDSEFKSQKFIDFMFQCLESLNEKIKINYFYCTYENFLEHYKDFEITQNADFTPFSRNRGGVKDQYLLDIEKIPMVYRFTPFFNKYQKIAKKQPTYEKSKCKGSVLKKCKYSTTFEEMKKKYYSGFIPQNVTAGTLLRFGVISVRQALKEIDIRNLMWREYCALCLFNHPESLSVQRIEKNYWDNTYFLQWTRGETGEPMIDAIMNELNETGYLINYNRLLTANYLTKILRCDWRLGAKYFAQKLIDYDISINTFNWQAVASVGISAEPWFHITKPSLHEDQPYIEKWLKKRVEPIVNFEKRREEYKKMNTYNK